MQQYLNLKIDNELCIISGYSDSHMYILGEFFRCEVGKVIDYWINWLGNDTKLEICGNWIWLDKIDSDYVVMGDGTMEPYDGVSELSSSFLLIKKIDLIKLLIVWGKLCSSEWKEIKITKDNENFEMFVNKY